MLILVVHIVYTPAGSRLGDISPRIDLAADGTLTAFDSPSATVRAPFRPSTHVHHPLVIRSVLDLEGRPVRMQLGTAEIDTRHQGCGSAGLVGRYGPVVSPSRSSITSIDARHDTCVAGEAGDVEMSLKTGWSVDTPTAKQTTPATLPSYMYTTATHVEMRSSSFRTRTP